MFAAVQQLQTPPVAWSNLLPVLILLGGAILLMVLGALFPPRPRWSWHAAFTVVVALGSIGSAIPLWFEVRDHGARSAVAGAVRIDGLGLFLGITMAVSVILAALLSSGYLRREHLEGSEPYVLMLLSASGGVIMASANDLLVLFLGLEILSIAVYVLAGIHLRRARSGEASLKYFVLGAFSSAFFLYGIAFVYGATGSTNFTDIQQFLADNVLKNDLMLVAGLALLLVGLGFKVSAVPFHSWSPDVYDGSPSPVVAYMASGVKVAGFAGLIRVFTYTFTAYRVDWQPLVYVVAFATLMVGAVIAVSQTNVKRMMAYSSINHAGFILLGVQAANDNGSRAALFYLAAYTFIVSGTFGVITIVGRTGDNAHQLSSYRGLARRSPLLAFAFLVFLLAQAGVPFTAGFWAKFYVIGASIGAHSYWLALGAMLSAVISAFVYLRIILTMYGEDPDEDTRPLTVPGAARAALVLSVIATIGFGLVPGPLVDAARTAVKSSPIEAPIKAPPAGSQVATP